MAARRPASYFNGEFLMNHIVLLSGGMGQRLWPLSTLTRPKQYIRFLADEQTGKPCSMVQRVWKQLAQAGLAENSVICAGMRQEEILHGQLGNVGIALEPEGRDTFAAVLLSCAYLKSRKGASDDDTVCFMPVDPYTEQSYFELLKRMPGVLSESGAEIVLMGIRPRFASGSYGYLVPGRRGKGYLFVDSFAEKPGVKEAERLIALGALWNGGVFCLRVGKAMGLLTSRDLPTDYDSLCREYSSLPRDSFDRAVVEKCGSLAAVKFSGMWKDIGTWDAASKVLDGGRRTNCVEDASCRNFCAVNETGIPLVAVGVKNLIVAASSDGILVADAGMDLHLKQIISGLETRPSFEEKSWGTSTVLDFFREGGAEYLVRELRMGSGMELNCPGANATGSVSVLKGGGFVASHTGELELLPGACFPVPAGEPFLLRAGKTGLVLVVTQKGQPGSFTCP